MRRRALLLLALLGACDQVRVEPVAELPPGLPPGAGDPLRFALETAAHAFLDREAALRGDPAQAALASAMVEFLATAFQDASRFADGPWITRLLREGRTALRGVVGIDAPVLPQAALDALLAARTAFRRGDAAAAAAALAPVAAPGARPASALAALETPPPLRRALRETRSLVARSLQP